MNTSVPHPPYILRPGVPEEVFTDRQEFLDFFHNAALKAITRRTMSTMLLEHGLFSSLFPCTMNKKRWYNDK